MSQDATASRDENTYTFTNCGQGGQYGPSQSQCNSAYSGTNLEGIVTVDNGIQRITIQAGTYVSIRGAGARGGYGSNSTIALGAVLQTDSIYFVDTGTILNILVGQAGENGSYNAGGGGGTFIWKEDGTLLLAAGGGGGGGDSFNSYQHASLTGSGNNGGGQMDLEALQAVAEVEQDGILME